MSSLWVTRIMGIGLRSLARRHRPAGEYTAAERLSPRPDQSGLELADTNGPPREESENTPGSSVIGPPLCCPRKVEVERYGACVLYLAERSVIFPSVIKRDFERFHRVVKLT